jgi:hypothetical protein
MPAQGRTDVAECPGLAGELRRAGAQAASVVFCTLTQARSAGLTTFLDTLSWAR